MKFFLIVAGILLISVTALAQSEIELVGIVKEANGDAVAGAEVKIIGGGRCETTTSGEFRIKIPIAKIGTAVWLQVSKAGWTVVRTKQLVPRDSAENPIDIELRRRTQIGPAGINPRPVAGDEVNRNRTDRLRTARRRIEAAPSRNRTVILVANFFSLEQGDNSAVTESILARLRGATDGYADVSIRALGHTIREQQGSPEARKLGKEHNARVVLWGWYSQKKDKTLINVSFEVLERPRLLSLRQASQMLVLPTSELDSFAIQLRLSNEMSYLTLLTVGLARLDVDDFDGAIDRFTSALKDTDVPDQIVDPADLFFSRGTAHFLKGFYYRESDLNEAIKDLSEAVNRNGNHVKALLLRAEAYVLRNKGDLGIADLNRVLLLDPQNIYAHFSLAWAYLSNGDQSQGLHQLTLAKNLRGPDFPGFREYVQGMITSVQKDDPGPMIAGLDRSINRNARGDPLLVSNLVLMRGSLYAAKEEWDRALGDFERAVRLEPKIARRVHYLRGMVFSEKGDHKRAIEELTKAIDSDQTFSEAYRERAAAYNELNLYEGAITDYGRLIELNPDDSTAYHDRAHTHILARHYDEAIADYNKAIEIKPDYADAYRRRGLAFMHQAKFDAALVDLTECIRLRSGDKDGYVARGLAYEMKGEYEKAISDYDEASKINPKYSTPYMNRSIAYKSLGNLQKAIDELDNYIKLEPSNGSGYLNRGLVLLANGEKDKAILDLRKAFALGGDFDVRKQAQQKLLELGIKVK